MKADLGSTATMFKGIAVIFITAAVILPAYSATIYVPDNYPKIQDAINASANGDTIIVRPGTYVENIDFVGKAITIKSEHGANVTTIDGNQAGSVVTFQNSEGLNSVLVGFTITNGIGTYSALYYFGGGTYLDNASPTILNNIINNNTCNSGGGVYCNNSSPILLNNIISYNITDGSGGGLSCVGSSDPEINENKIIENKAGVGGGIFCMDTSSPDIRNNIISNNSVFEDGGGICCYDLSAPTIINNIIYKNEAVVYGGGICYDDNSTPTIINNTIIENWVNLLWGGGIFCSSTNPISIANMIMWNNSAPIGNEIYDFSGNMTVNYCDIKGGWTGIGNIDTDPLFANPANDDFHLSWYSPCRNSGDNSAVTKFYDFEGDPRIAGKSVDMGADEFYYHLYSVGDVQPGSPLDLKVVGVPGLPALLALGTGIQNPQQSTQHGDLWLKLPLAMQWQLGPIPSTGILTMNATVPSGWPSGSTHPFQALLGPWGGGATTRLTNLMSLTVE